MSTDVISALEKVLADSYSLYLKTQNYHWNVVGPHFGALHALFETQYEDLAEAVDELAERIRALDGLVKANFDAFKSLSSVKPGNEAIPYLDMIKDLAADQDVVLKSLKDCFDIAEKNGDVGTTNMLEDRIGLHEKNKWMLESHLK